MAAAEHEEDRTSITVVRLRSRDTLIERLEGLADDLADIGYQLDDSDWPPPPSQPLAPFSVAPSTPPVSERH